MHTTLYNWHLKQQAKIVDFHGFDLPINYQLGVSKEHLFCRENAGLFDVSHMGQVTLFGDNCDKEIEKILPIDTATIANMTQVYSVMLDDNGGIIDDLIIAKISKNNYRLVLNAGNIKQDLQWLQQHLPASITLELAEDYSLIALQGPKARAIIAEHCPELKNLAFNNIANSSIDGIEILVACCGYTGEDGFEISCRNNDVEQLADILNKHHSVTACGLGARDTLRLEAGLCLHGNDITVETTAIEANLLFTINKSRRPGGSKAGGYSGCNRINQQLETGVKQKRVALVSAGKIPMRTGTDIFANSDNGTDSTKQQWVGIITSGCISPTLKQPIAMAYINADTIKSQQPLIAQIRTKQQPVQISKFPFVKNNYFR